MSEISIDVRKNVSYHNYGELIMEKTINITNLRKDLYKISESVINDGLVVNVSCKNGNFIMISQEDYYALLETLYLSSDPNIKKSLLEGKNTSDEDCIKEEDVTW